MDVFGDEAFNVPDSTDWLGTPLACLMPVEQAFRCHVCKDFYDSPMLTSCNHTFCSLCIRRCLSVDSKCPLCRATDQESKLRGNWALREAVEAFKNSRKVLLEFARTPPTIQAILPDQAGPSSPSKRKATEMEGPKEEDPESKRPRRSTRSTRARAAELTAAILQEEQDTTPSADPDYVDQPPDDGLVACPICLTRMKEQQVDRHLDTSCPGSPQAASKRRPIPAQTPQPSTFPSFNTRLTSQTNQKPPERLPALAYSMLRDTALRKKLSELGLSTHGSRQLLEKRHKEWITLWNANCDSSRPKKRSELLRDLDEWERTVGNPGTAAGGGGGQQGLGLMARAQATGAQIKDKEFDGKAWATRYGGSFGDLIKQARQGIKRQTLDGNGEKADTKGGGGGEDVGPAELPTLQAREGESSAAPTRMDIVPPSSPPRPGQVDDADTEHDGQAPGKDAIAEDTAMREQVIPGTPDKERQWETSQQQQPPIPGDAQLSGMKKPNPETC
ncbi:Postreplication repair E3 ubiquitin-protein ligase rad-18 [Neurospora crassa]|uniref:Postreplication repair E3 ubiquitin-protein ligase rad18 n=1 Tax=Neurospora crassa (strain ATCC 24698 / 74-OR23-1A / CBS 708.71 / DSM 1257 / FGSC 987) TaxID=367110 RepID=RAD18_NEUCR|nr:postreplication repair E3 ubiquitin-protein ligase rad-18 [Neurospora crassa OR74A]P33288.2 RecName: Full=Postreplication repair E3 ubiquitin-protein ligase rad18; AltName: Full=RING-type E3 ubiquitin transferase rad18; AltName: Full=UV radiation sensitivity protein 2 [Neurospora crassa OR74A]EAA32973.2 postreplication repair E3 ubiquitin-protein ligase rad-18 [Neurospora crassa OR74A]KHE85405.1 Postreplication repair E3 ubiquitin-protein ligase rad-18 [Neurospora crassa]|eukprot:XP_962209.2 postreplication repair E3 ubiquitin-protein ligase rad-18 [Neurospora crassa OR74A]